MSERPAIRASTTQSTGWVTLRDAERGVPPLRPAMSQKAAKRMSMTWSQRVAVAGNLERVAACQYRVEAFAEDRIHRINAC
jgi:hypothetical protein